MCAERRRQVVVALHAHPDDEALLTGGTLARLAAAGHRTVLVTATAGGRGLADQPAGSELAARRDRELADAAHALGVDRVVRLGYADSGSGDAPEPGGFATVPVAEVAARVAEVLVEEGADVLIGYDRNGGYGHPDHRHVHAVARAAAERAGTPRLLHATVDRTWIRRAVTLLAAVGRLPEGTDRAHLDRWYTDRSEITHRIPVQRFAAAKRRALAAHASQAGGGNGPRTVSVLLRLPTPVFVVVAGTEWFAEDGGHRGRRPHRDLLQASSDRPSQSVSSCTPGNVKK